MEEVCLAAVLLCQVMLLLQDRVTAALNTHTTLFINQIQPCHEVFMQCSSLFISSIFHSISQKIILSFLNGFGGTSSQ
jgi:hypothetical protein